MKLKINVKFILCCVLWLLILLLLAGCVVGWAGCSAVYNYFFDYEGEAKEKGELLAEALEDKDTASIEKLFSPYARGMIDDFDGKVQELVDFMEGDVQSVKVESSGGSSYSGGSAGERYREVSIYIEIKTSKSKYEITFNDLVDTEKDSKLGLYYLDIAGGKVDYVDSGNARRGGVPGIMCFYDTQNMQYVGETQAKGEEIAQALKEKDAEAIKGLFSEYAVREMGDIDNKLEKWFQFIKGEVVSTDVYTNFGYSYNGYNEKYTHNWTRINVETDEGNYIITATDCVSDEQEDKPGILYLEVINRKDIEGQDWKGQEWSEDWTIYRDNPDIRYLTDAPDDDIPTYEW